MTMKPKEAVRKLVLEQRSYARFGLLCALSVFLLLLLTSANALADYRDSPSEKLEAAKAHVQEALADDARPGQEFFSRTPKFPVWKDQPVIDCAISGISRAIQARRPYFEDAKESVVIVPVWVELLILDAHESSGFPYGRDEAGVEQCRFEYERYSFNSGRFEKIPKFHQAPHLSTLGRLGELSPEVEGGHRRSISINPENRYVRFNIRVSVMERKPYQLHPQFPRHSNVSSTLKRLNEVIKTEESLLDQGVSDRDRHAVGQVLARDLKRMRQQIDEMKWVDRKLKNSLELLKHISPFSEISEQ